MTLTPKSPIFIAPRCILYIFRSASFDEIPTTFPKESSQDSSKLSTGGLIIAEKNIIRHLCTPTSHGPRPTHHLEFGLVIIVDVRDDIIQQSIHDAILAKRSKKYGLIHEEG